VVIATGQSGHPMSPHWADLLPGWREGTLLHLGPAPAQPAGRVRLLP
jgi:penicillin amidase